MVWGRTLYGVAEEGREGGGRLMRDRGGSLREGELGRPDGTAPQKRGARKRCGAVQFWRPPAPRHLFHLRCPARTFPQSSAMLRSPATVMPTLRLM